MCPSAGHPLQAEQKHQQHHSPTPCVFPGHFWVFWKWLHHFYTVMRLLFLKKVLQGVEESELTSSPVLKPRVSAERSNTFWRLGRTEKNGRGPFPAGYYQPPLSLGVKKGQTDGREKKASNLQPVSSSESPARFFNSKNSAKWKWKAEASTQLLPPRACLCCTTRFANPACNLSPPTPQSSNV